MERRQREEMERVREELGLEEQAEAARQQEIVSTPSSHFKIFFCNAVKISFIHLRFSPLPCKTMYFFIFTLSLTGRDGEEDPQAPGASADASGDDGLQADAQAS